MSKSASKYRAAKKVAEKVIHGNLLKTNIPAGMAIAGPPLGPMLGQRNINISLFCKEFNERTAHIKKGIPLPTRVTIKPDRTFSLTIHTPPVTYFVLQAAGMSKGAMIAGQEIGGKISLKHVYEIAKIKSQDPTMECVPLEVICKMVVGTAKSCGIEVVKKLERDEYAQFLEERKAVLETQQQELEEKRQAKMLRTA